jgi:hypothetical protein
MRRLNFLNGRWHYLPVFLFYGLLNAISRPDPLVLYAFSQDEESKKKSGISFSFLVQDDSNWPLPFPYSLLSIISSPRKDDEWWCLLQRYVPAGFK